MKPDCATRACTLLKDRTTIPEGLQSEIETSVKRSLPFPSSTALAGKSSILDSVGSQLWNATTNFLRDVDNEPDDSSKQRRHTRLVVLLRVFGYLLVDAAHNTSTRRTKDQDQRIRIFKIAVKACRFCLDAGEVELAMKVLERLSEYASSVEEDLPIVRISDAAHGDRAEHEHALKQLVTEYYLLRMTHAWRTERYDLADHFYTKLNAHELATSAPLAEKAADLFYEAGKALASSKLWDLATKWCERALNALAGCEIADLSHDAPELRLAVTATFVEALLNAGSAESHERAASLVRQLEEAHGMSNRIAVALLRFQILTAEEPIDLDQVDAVMTRMVRRVVLTDSSFKMYALAHLVLIVRANSIIVASCRPYTSSDV